MLISMSKPASFCATNSNILEIQVFSSFWDIPASDWEIATNRENTFLQIPYLKVVELNPPDHFKFRYVLVYRNNNPIAAFYFQVRNFNATKSLKIEVEQRSIWNSIIAKAKKFIASFIDFNTLVLGNLLLTGEHGFYFNTIIENSEKNDIILKVIASCKEDLNKAGIKVSAVLIKDFQEKIAEFPKSYNEFRLEPSMILDIKDGWNQIQDYIEALNTKARTRFKRAEKKLEPIVCKPINTDEVLLLKEEIHHLYQSVSQKAAFNLYNLNIDYLIELEKEPLMQLSMHGFFLNDTLVGFSTLIENNQELEAHIIGHNPEVNNEHQLYLNMLYNMINCSILLKKKKLILARTAIEIKSSIGAVANEMHCYLMHQNKIANRLFPYILNYLYPKKDWTYRHPFK